MSLLGRNPTMRILIVLPEDIAKQLQTRWRDISREALEAVGVEGYGDGTPNRVQVGQLLGLSFW